MSTNHNRIKVADLETNDSNKILKTNRKGELEFCDAHGLSVELASDLETQIYTAVPEDEKVISRSKLFNWWQWVKSQSQTVSGMWNFTNKVTLASGNTNNPSLIIPNGTLTAAPQNGAVERDSKGKLWNTFSGIRTELVPTRFSKNIGGFINTMSYIFNKPNSTKNDIIEMYNSSAGSSKIYPSNFNTRDIMAVNDVIDSEIIMLCTNSAALSLIIRFEVWRTLSNGTSVLNNTFDYAWETSSQTSMPLRVVSTRIANTTGVSSLSRYAIFVNNVYKNAADVNDIANSDVRLKLINNTNGTNHVYIYPVKCTNQFIPTV